MAVGRLSGKWVLEILHSQYPDGVLRRKLLDDFAAVLVSKRSSRGAKGRVARRLYLHLARLQRRGLICQEEGIVRPVLTSKGLKRPKEEPKTMGTLLQKKYFLALLAEDRSEGDQNSPHLRSTRFEFLGFAIEAGWTVLQAAAALGITESRARGLIETPPPRVPGNNTQR